MPRDLLRRTDAGWNYKAPARSWRFCGHMSMHMVMVLVVV